MQFEKKTLKNGLSVVLAPMENTEAVTLLVLIGVGSRYETKKINGISHFLEHLFFKGTKRRPKSGQLDKELDGIGASYNAFTSKEYTGFWVKSATSDFDISLDIVSDMLLNSLFEKKGLEREQGVILQEIAMYEDDPRRRVFEILEGVLYHGNPIGFDVLGTKESVKSIKRSDIVKYVRDNYLSGNIIIAAAGNFDKKTVFEKIEKAFGKIAKGKNRSSRKTKISQNSPKIKIVHKDSDQTHLTLAFRGYGMFDNRRYTLNLLSVILGGNMSSLLFREIREKLGLAYYVYAFGDQYTDCGYLGMAAGIPHDKLETVVKKIIEVAKKIKEKGVSKSDLEHAKSFVRGQMALKFEASDEVASFVASQGLFYDKIKTPKEILKRIEKVSQSDMLKVANDIFRSSKVNMAVIGCHENIDKKEALYKKIFSQL